MTGMSEDAERIVRITEMETRLNRVKEWLSGDPAPDFSVNEDVCALDEYYRSPMWLSDFEADEAGKLPEKLKRGVLSEDAVYDVLMECERRKK